jgi:hypothetical protein
LRRIPLKEHSTYCGLRLRINALLPSGIQISLKENEKPREDFMLQSDTILRLLTFQATDYSIRGICGITACD